MKWPAPWGAGHFFLTARAGHGTSHLRGNLTVTIVCT